MFLGEPAVRRRRTLTGYDSANRLLYGWSEEPLPVGCALDPGGSREPAEAGRAQVITTPKAYFTELVDVIAGDELVIRGRTWQVVGDPAVWVSPFRSSVGGTVVELQASSEEG